MKLWKIELIVNDYFIGRSRCRYTGMATTAEIAIRQAKRKAKKEGFAKIRVATVEYLGDREFGG